MTGVHTPCVYSAPQQSDRARGHAESLPALSGLCSRQNQVTRVLLGTYPGPCGGQELLCPSHCSGKSQRPGSQRDQPGGSREGGTWSRSGWSLAWPSPSRLCMEPRLQPPQDALSAGLAVPLPLPPLIPCHKPGSRARPHQPSPSLDSGPLQAQTPLFPGLPVAASLQAAALFHSILRVTPQAPVVP